MLKKANQILTCIAFAIVVLFCVYALSEVVRYANNAGDYVVRSAPWHTGILMSGTIAIVALAVVIAIKLAITVLWGGADDGGVQSMFYSAKKSVRIETHEARMLNAYAQALKQYEPEIERHGCSLKVNLCWRDPVSGNTELTQRPAFQEGYVCWVHCALQRDGENAYVNYIFDGERIGKCELSRKWRISEIFWGYVGQRVFLQTKVTEDMIYDMQNILSDLHMGVHKLGNDCALVEPQEGSEDV